MDSFTLGAALQRYLNTITPRKKSREQEARRIKKLLTHPLATFELNTLRGAAFARYRDERLALGLSASSVRLELAIISHLYTIAASDWGMEDLKNPIKTLSKPRPSRGRNRRLLDGEEARLLAAIDTGKPWLKPLVLLALETAARLGELLALHWADVHLAKRVMLFRDTKNGEPRTVPLSTKAKNIFNDLPRENEKVFQFERSYISRSFHAATLAAGLDDLRFHDLRHEATSRLVELNRFTMLEISLITGHKTLAMLQRYTHLNAAALAARLD